MSHCEKCNRPDGWEAIEAGTLHDDSGCECDACCSHCWDAGQFCEYDADTDWRARCLAAEADRDRYLARAEAAEADAEDWRKTAQAPCALCEEREGREWRADQAIKRAEASAEHAIGAWANLFALLTEGERWVVHGDDQRMALAVHNTRAVVNARAALTKEASDGE